MSALSVRPRLVVAVLVCAGIALFALANAHFVYVALKSEPDCVAHLKAEANTPGSYRAARSAC